jgi:hypothetical protein
VGGKRKKTQNQCECKLSFCFRKLRQILMFLMAKEKQLKEKVFMMVGSFLLVGKF